MNHAQSETVFDGTRYAKEIESLIQNMESGIKGSGDTNTIARMREYLEFGPMIIDTNDNDKDRVLRYLIVHHASLVDQNAMNTQHYIGSATRILLVPLWLCAIALSALVFQGL